MLTEAKTRDELQAMVKAALTPADLAMIDQREAVMRETRATFEGNRALMLDPKIESRVLWLMKEHGSNINRGDNYVAAPQHLRVENRRREELDVSRPCLYPLGWCDYCYEIASRGDCMLTSVPVGSYAVELMFCSTHAAYLQKCFPTVQWSGWTDEQYEAEVERRRRSHGAM